MYFGFTAASTGGANNVQTVCLSANILGSAEQGYICPGAEAQLNVPSTDGTATWTPTDYLDDPTSASPHLCPARRAHRAPRLRRELHRPVWRAVSDTLALTVAEMTAEVNGLADITCLNDVVDVTGTSNFPGPLDFQWLAPQGGISGNNALATVSQPGDYLLIVTFDDGLCTAEQEFTVAVDTVSYTGVFPETGYLTCDETTVALEAESLSNPAASVSWSTTGGAITSSSSAVTATQPGLYTATVTNPGNECTSENAVEVIAADAAPVLNGGSVEPLTCLTPNQPVVGAGIQDYAPFGTGNLTPVISWINADNGTTMGVSPSTGSIGPIIDAPGTYELTVTWQETGCSSSVTLEAIEGEDFGVDISSITFPNILTANNDGKNDSWYPFLADLPDVEALGVLTNYALRVYNQWGQVVYTNAAMVLPRASPSGGMAMATGAILWLPAPTTTSWTTRRPAATARAARRRACSRSSASDRCSSGAGGLAQKGPPNWTALFVIKAGSSLVAE